jgi:hypothetical protein
VQQHHNSPDANLAWLIALLSRHAPPELADGADHEAHNTPAEHCPNSENAAGSIVRSSPKGLGSCKDKSTVSHQETSAAAAAAASDGAELPLDTSHCSRLLNDLALLSKGTRWDGG